MLDVTAASSQVATFPSYVIPAATDAYICLVGGNMATNGSNIGRFLAQGLSGNVYVAMRGDRTGFSIRGTGMAAAVEARFPANAPSVGTCDIMELIIGADGSATAYLNGVAGTPLAASSVTGGFTFDQVGRTTTGLTAEYGVLTVKTGTLTAGERTAWLAYLEPWRSKVWWVKPSTGSDSNTGWNEANAWSTLGKSLAAPVRNGDTIYPVRGETFNLASSLSVSGAPAATMDFGYAGTGEHALVTMSTLPTDWTVSSGSVYTRTANGPYENNGGSACLYDTQASHPASLHSYNPAATVASFNSWWPAMAAAVLANPNGQRMFRNTTTPTTPAAGEYGYTGGAYYIRMSDGGNPNGRVRVPSRGADPAVLFSGAGAVAISTAGFAIKGGRWWYGSSTGMDMSVEASAQFIDVRYWDSDGFDGFGAATVKTYSDTFGGWCGVGVSTGSNGDITSNHGGTMNRDRILAVMGDKSGIGDTNGCAGNNNHVVMIGRNRPIAIFDNDATQGAQVYTNFAAVVLDGGDRGYIHNDGGLLTLRFGTIHGIGTATSKEGVRNDAGATNASSSTLLDCIITNGLETGLNNISGTVSRTYTIINSATAVTGGVSGTTGNSTSAANLTNPDTLNFRPAVGSPAIGAGLAIGGVTIDLAGGTRASPPAIGALEPA